MVWQPQRVSEAAPSTSRQCCRPAHAALGHSPAISQPMHALHANQPQTHVGAHQAADAQLKHFYLLGQRDHRGLCLRLLRGIAVKFAGRQGRHCGVLDQLRVGAHHRAGGAEKLRPAGSAALVLLEEDLLGGRGQGAAGRSGARRAQQRQQSGGRRGAAARASTAVHGWQGAGLGAESYIQGLAVPRGTTRTRRMRGSTVSVLTSWLRYRSYMCSTAAGLAYCMYPPAHTLGHMMQGGVKGEGVLRRACRGCSSWPCWRPPCARQPSSAAALAAPCHRPATIPHMQRVHLCRG